MGLEDRESAGLVSTFLRNDFYSKKESWGYSFGNILEMEEAEPLFNQGFG